MPLPYFLYVPALSCWCCRGQLCPVCTGRFSRCSALIHLYILTLLCVCRQTSAAPLAAGAPRSGERSQETVWPPSVNYVFTARPGSHWACSAQYISPAADDKGSDASVGRRLQWRRQILLKKIYCLCCPYRAAFGSSTTVCLAEEEKKCMFLLAAWCKISTYHSA